MSLRILVIAVIILANSGCSGKTKEELYAEGLRQITKLNPDSAIVLFKNALEKDHNYYDARYQLAVAYMSVGNYKQAEKELQKLRRQNPTRSDIKLELARVNNFLSSR